MLGSQEIWDFLTHLGAEHKDVPLPNLVDMGRHAFFETTIETRERACCEHHFAVMMFLVGFRTAEMYFVRQKEIEDLARLHDAKTPGM